MSKLYEWHGCVGGRLVAKVTDAVTLLHYITVKGNISVTSQDRPLKQHILTIFSLPFYLPFPVPLLPFPSLSLSFLSFLPSFVEIIVIFF